MLEDRYYMREPEFKTRSAYSMFVVLFVLHLGVFVLQEINRAYGTFPFFRYLPLSVSDLTKGYVWQLFTYQFLHYDRMHFILNMLVYYMFGKPVIESLGNRHFAIIYLVSGFVGGIVQSILGFSFPPQFGLPVVGASAGVFGLVATFATLDPTREIFFLFILRMQARVFLWIALAVAVFYILVPAEPHIAHGAHLGGLLLGVAYIRWRFHQRFPAIRFQWHPFRNRARRRQLVRAASVKPGFWKGAKDQQFDEVEPEEFISREVDPILDKISAQGIQSLTPREKQILEAARAKMDKR